MLKLVKRSVSDSSSLVVLKIRIVYLESKDHPNHKNKHVQVAKNHHLIDQSANAFIAATLLLRKKYTISRRGKCGKRTSKLFDEFIYRTPQKIKLTPKEKEKIALMIIKAVAPNCACRYGWHLGDDNSGDDLHVFSTAITMDEQPKVNLSSQFGSSQGKSIHGVLAKLDKKIAGLLQENPEHTAPLATPIEIRISKKARKKKGTKLANNLAKIKGDITSNNISQKIASLGHKVTKITKKGIVVIFKGSDKKYWHCLVKLFGDINFYRDPGKEI